MKNLELKARYSDFGFAAQILASLGIEKVWTHRQIDSYFEINDGKLKLRQVDGKPAELIYYKRSSGKGPKISDYSLFRTDFDDDLRHILNAALQVELIVDKIRTLYLWRNVRIHFDKVVGLGEFIEFEAVLSKNAGLAESEKRIAFLRQKLRIDDKNLIDQGYYELYRMMEGNSR